MADIRRAGSEQDRPHRVNILTGGADQKPMRPGKVGPANRYRALRHACRRVGQPGFIRPQPGYCRQQRLGGGSAQEQLRPRLALIGQRDALADEIVIQMAEDSLPLTCNAVDHERFVLTENEHVGQGFALHRGEKGLAAGADGQLALRWCRDCAARPPDRRRSARFACDGRVRLIQRMARALVFARHDG